MSIFRTHIKCYFKELLVILLFTNSLSTNAQDWIKVEADSVQEYGIICVPARIYGVKFSKMLVDTGASLVTMPYSDYLYAKKSGMLKHARFVKDAFIDTPIGSGDAKIYEFDSFEIGGVILDKVWIMFASTRKSIRRRLIGQNIMRRFRTLNIDWETNTVFLQLKDKNKKHGNYLKR